MVDDSAKKTHRRRAEGRRPDLERDQDLPARPHQRLSQPTWRRCKENAQQYHDLAEQSGFDTKKLLADHQPEVAKLLGDAKKTYVDANPAYEEMEGVVAGVPSLADYDVIIDAGGDASDPENAVPFSIKTEDGKTFKQPGNLFFLVESSLYGTEPKWSAKGDVDGDGKVAFGEALPEPRFYLAALNEFDKQAKELDASAKKWTPTEQDALTALVVMTPTMSEYFEAWKNSRFVAGDKATEKSFVGASRLQDIADILGGLKLIYANVAAEDRGGEQGAGRPDRAVADRARGLRGAPARPGGGRQEVHRRGRRHARPPRRRTRPRRSRARSPRPPSS